MIAASPLSWCGRHQAVGIDRGDHVEVARELRLPGHVADRAVGVLGEDRELLLLAWPQHARRSGRRAAASRPRRVRGGGRGAGGDPAPDHLVVRAVRAEPLAAAVRDLAGRLQQEQARSGAAGNTRRPRASLAMAA